MLIYSSAIGTCSEWTQPSGIIVDVLPLSTVSRAAETPVSCVLSKSLLLLPQCSIMCQNSSTPCQKSKRFSFYDVQKKERGKRWLYSVFTPYSGNARGYSSDAEKKTKIRKHEYTNTRKYEYLRYAPASTVRTYCHSSSLYLRSLYEVGGVLWRVLIFIIFKEIVKIYVPTGVTFTV
jgi:hypothetical protein